MSSRATELAGGPGTGVASKAALDPQAILADPNYGAVCTLKRTLYAHSLYHLVTEGLGIGPKATIYVNDPGVRSSVD